MSIQFFFYSSWRRPCQFFFYFYSSGGVLFPGAATFFVVVGTRLSPLRLSKPLTFERWRWRMQWLWKGDPIYFLCFRRIHFATCRDDYFFCEGALHLWTDHRRAISCPMSTPLSWRFWWLDLIRHEKWHKKLVPTVRWLKNAENGKKKIQVAPRMVIN